MNYWINLLDLTFLFFFPAYLANLSPVIFSKINFLKGIFEFKLDIGKKLFGKRIFGDNKTLGGLIVGTFGGVIGAIIVILMINLFNWKIDLIGDKNILFMAYLGFLLGLGALLGDLLESFVKRRIGILEGRPWWLFDQLDFVLGAWLFSGLLIPYSETWLLFLMALIITPPGHLLLNLLAFKLKLKKVWW